MTTPDPKKTRTEQQHGMTTGMSLAPGQALEIDQRVDQLVRRVLKRVMIRFVIPAFVVVTAAFSASLAVSLHVLHQRDHDAYCTRVDSRDQVRGAFLGTAGLFGGPTVEAQELAYLDQPDHYPALPPKDCN